MDSKENYVLSTICPRSSDPFYIVTYYMKRVTTSWTDGMREKRLLGEKITTCETMYTNHSWEKVAYRGRGDRLRVSCRSLIFNVEGIKSC